jgi:RimJ/RimL family protein N-acetyltransferase
MNVAVKLRAPSAEDAAMLLELRNDVDLQRSLLAHPRPNDEGAVQEWIARRQSESSSRFFIVADAASDHGVGFVQVIAIDEISGHGELGICIHPDYQARGYGSSALEEIESLLATSMGLRKLILQVDAKNSEARDLYARHGYRKVGVLQDHYVDGDLPPCDVVVMEHVLGP